MTIRNTIYQNEESERKQLKMPIWAYQWLQSNDSEIATKGYKAYEALLFKFDHYEDPITDIESIVDEKLASLTGESFVNSLKKLKHTNPHVDQADTRQVESVNIHLPISFIGQLTVKRWIGEHIAEAVECLANSVFDDRLDRIQCKREIAEYIDGERDTVEHNIAEAVVDGYSDSINADFDKVHHLYNYYTNPEWYLSDDVTLNDLQKRGTEISQRNRSDRIEALETAIRNSSYQVDDRDDLIELVQNVYDIGTDQTAQKYADQVSLLSVANDAVEMDFYQLVDFVVLDKTIEESEVYDSKIEYLDFDTSAVVEGEFSKDEALEALDKLNAAAFSRQGKKGDQDELQTLKQWTRRAMDVLEGEADESTVNVIKHADWIEFR